MSVNSGMAVYANRYVELPRPAQAGGMGTVVRCHDPHLDREVAIKFLLAGQDRRRISDEVRALQKIRSKHVVQVYDIVVAQPGNQIGIVQEYLPGDDLVPFAKLRPTGSIYLRTIHQLAVGLEDIHAQGLIHRDMKPNNVKRDGEQLLKIFDFGLSRPDADREAQTRGFVGTQGYAAPELYASGEVRFTPAVDVYAFGIVALYLAKGSLPPDITAQPPRAEAWAKARGFATLASAPPARVSALLNSCLANDPKSRPTSATLRRSIEQHLVQDQHRALLFHNGRTIACDRAKPKVTLSKEGVGSMTILYDGLGFAIADAQGDLYVNNVQAVAGERIPTSCVITLGAPDLQNARVFVTMDISRPEVVL